MRALVLMLALTPGVAFGDSLIALRTIPAGVVLAPGDIGFAPKEFPGALEDPAEAIGLETRVVLYSGRPIRMQDIGPPALVDRNQPVMLIYRRGPLTIIADGRALGRGAVGERVQAMNLDSRNIVNGAVTEDGAILVGGHRSARATP